jgi:tRNA(adenine34) deaminase
MRAALQAARDGMKNGEVPIGAAIADGNGEILVASCNRMNATGRKTAHAELMAFEDGEDKIDLQANDLIVASTLEPCVMCGGAMMLSGVDTVIFGLEAPFDGATHRVSAPRSPESQFPRFIGGILADESRALLQEWLERNHDSEQAAYVKQLLSGTRNK